MDSPTRHLSANYQAVIDRFVAACRADERVVAAFLGGSFARGTADAYSDLDLYLITTDEAYQDFVGGRTTFMRLLGDPLFLEDFNDFGFDLLLFILRDGTEGELAFGRESHFTHIHNGPFRVLLDKKDVLAGAVFSWHVPAQAEQTETLRRLIYWFWHDLSHHFITSLGRGRLWSAYGYLEELRRTCLNLVRLRQDFSAAAEGYEAVERAVPLDRLAPLQATFCPIEPEAMLRAALAIVQFYQELAPPLAREHGIPYPEDLSHMMVTRLEQLCDAHLR